MAGCAFAAAGLVFARDAQLQRADVFWSGGNDGVRAHASARTGGSAPGVELPTWLVSVGKDGVSAAGLEERLRGAPVPIIARIEEDRVVIDLRTVDPQDDKLLATITQ